MIQPPEPPQVVIKVQQDKPSVWSKVWDFCRKYILAPIPILVIAVVALALIFLGAKNIQIGGIIGKILGRKGEAEDGKKAIEIANTVPKNRVDPQGHIIPIGQPDSQGITQAKVVPIKEPGLFDDPKKVTIKDPEDGKEVKVVLPDGVRAKDVDQVVIVKPNVTAVSVKTKSKVVAPDVDDLLNKYKDFE